MRDKGLDIYFYIHAVDEVKSIAMANYYDT